MIYLFGDFVRKLFPRSLCESVVILEVVAINADHVAHLVHVPHEEWLQRREMAILNALGQ